MSNVETDRRVEEYSKEKKRNALLLMTLAGVLLANLAIFGFVTYQQNERLDNRSERISILEANLDNQRTQFLNCINVDPGTPGCLNPVSPNSEDVSGPSGERGLQGPQGPTGPQGLQGPQGFQGLMGLMGLNGLPGVDGAPGNPGTNGKDGVDGAQGPAGNDGAPGAPGRGVNGITCDGTTGQFAMSDGSTISVPNMCAGPPIVVVPDPEPEPEVPDVPVQ